MNLTAISKIPKLASYASIRFFNDPLVKERVKNTVGSVTFLFGVVTLYEMSQGLKKHQFVTLSSNDHEWQQLIHIIAVACDKVSLLLSAGTSRPGVFIVSKLINNLFSITQLERVWGPNTTFDVNPWHPRHVLSIVSVALATSSVGLSALSSGKLLDMQNLFFNILTSRFTLHIGNSILQQLSAYVVQEPRLL